MARIERIKQRLENWALWKERDARGGLGYASSSSFLRIVVDCGGGGDPLMSTVDEIEATKTDEAVTSLLDSKPHLYRTLQLIYIEGESIRRTAAAMFKAESTIKANLEKADFEIQTYLRLKEEDRERAAAAAK